MAVVGDGDGAPSGFGSGSAAWKERARGVEVVAVGGGEMEATGSERRGEVRPPDPDLDRGREEGRAVVGRGREEWGEWEWGLGFLGVNGGCGGWAG